MGRPLEVDVGSEGVLPRWQPSGRISPSHGPLPHGSQQSLQLHVRLAVKALRGGEKGKGGKLLCPCTHAFCTPWGVPCGQLRSCFPPGGSWSRRAPPCVTNSCRPRRCDSLMSSRRRSWPSTTPRARPWHKRSPRGTGGKERARVRRRGGKEAGSSARTRRCARSGTEGPKDRRSKGAKKHTRARTHTHTHRFSRELRMTPVSKTKVESTPRNAQSRFSSSSGASLIAL